MITTATVQEPVVAQAVTPPRTKPAAASWLGPLAITAFWLANVMFVSVAGDFPLNDDWIYAEGVKHFLQTGELRLLACAPACVFHLLFGALVCKIFGFSHVVLRSVGVFWAWTGTIALYGACREVRLNRLAATLFALTFAANPMIVNLAFSFMTDTPAFSLMLIYAFCALRAVRTRKEIYFVFATLALVAGSLVRQNLAMLAGIDAVVLLMLWSVRRHSWTLLLGLVVLPVVTGVFADKWMLATSDFSALYVWYKGMVSSTVHELFHAPSRLFLPLTQIAGELFCYIGLFSLPLLIFFHRAFLAAFGFSPSQQPRGASSGARVSAGDHASTSAHAGDVLPGSKRSNTQLGSQSIGTGWYCLSASILTYALTQYVVVGKKLMPFNQNLLRMPAVGAHTLLGINHPNLPNKVRSILTGVSGLAGFLSGALLGGGAHRAALLVIRVGSGIIKPKQKEKLSSEFEQRVRRVAAIVFCFALCASQWFFVMLQSSFSDIDRYYIFPFVSSLLCIALVWRWLAVKPGRFVLAASIGILSLYSVYSAAACQDLLAWNRARWDLLNVLQSKGVAAGDIDGGAEFNYYSNPALFKHLKLCPTWYELTHRGDPPRDQWRWWSIDKEEYIVSFSPVPEYEVVDQRNYWSALGGKRELFMLHKIAARADSTTVKKSD